ncbi:MAG: hypothetical protein GY859_25290, partial [Desulfobacterales bacterium]|nr:hypothetical protein [Desulfobacterales bacterium]
LGLILNGCALVCISIFMVGLIQGELSEKLSERLSEKKWDAPGRIDVTIPNGADAVTQKDFNKVLYRWLASNTVEAYRRSKQKNGSLDPEAASYLEDACRYRADQETAPGLKELEEKGVALLGKWCEDPLVLLHHGRTLFDKERYQEAETLAANALEGLRNSDYPKIQVFFAAEIILNVSNIHRDKGAAEKKRLTDMAMGVLRDAIESGGFGPSELPIAYRMARRLFDDEESMTFYERIRDIDGIDPWLLYMCEGEAEVDAAWEARGGGWAKKVSDEGWEGFRAHLQLARAALTEAWELRPDYPDAAGRMITVAMGGGAEPGEDEFFWFNRAVAAQMDFAPAYDALMLAL